MDRRKINRIVIFHIIGLMIFIASSGCKKKTPATPDILIPESTYTKAKTILRVSATDPNKDRIYYIVDWGDGITDTFPESGQEPFNSDDTVPVYHIYEKWSPPRIPAYKNFEIIATAKDEKGNIQNIWSQPETIKVIYNEEPNRPVIIHLQESGGMNTLQGFGFTATDTEGDSIAFCFSFFEDDSWTIFIASEDTIFPDNDTIAVFHLWTEPGTIGIWVIAKDKKGSISIPSETLEFKVLDEGYVKDAFYSIESYQGIADTFEMPSSPAIATIAEAEKIFVGGGGYAYIIDANDMRKDVEILIDETGWCYPSFTPAVDIQNSRWYIMNDKEDFYALSIYGYKLWYHPIFEEITEVAFNGNYVYIASTADTLYCLNGSNGIKIWGYSIPRINLKIAPIIDIQGDIYIGDDSGYVSKINGTTGELIWKINLGRDVPTSGAIDNITGIIYFGVNDGSNSNLCALEPDSGTLMWSYQIDEKIINSPVIGTDDYIFVGDEQGRIYAIKDGILKSGFPITLNRTLSTPAFAADGYFYVMTEEQFVYCIGVDGNIRWVTPLPTAELGKSRRQRNKCQYDIVPSPVIGSNGDIYVTAGGYAYGLYKIQGRSSGTPANTPWPMFRHDQNHSGKAGFTPNR